MGPYSAWVKCSGGGVKFYHSWLHSIETWTTTTQQQKKAGGWSMYKGRFKWYDLLVESVRSIPISRHRAARICFSHRSVGQRVSATSFGPFLFVLSHWVEGSGNCIFDSAALGADAIDNIHSNLMMWTEPSTPNRIGLNWSVCALINASVYGLGGLCRGQRQFRHLNAKKSSEFVEA